jgi:hypothetical protein
MKKPFRTSKSNEIHELKKFQAPKSKYQTNHNDQNPKLQRFNGLVGQASVPAHIGVTY